MKSISPYAYASIMILIRLFSLSLYTPYQEENPGLTALACVLFFLIKLAFFIPLIFAFKKFNGNENLGRFASKITALFFLMFSVLFLILLSLSFSTAIQTIYPNSFTSIALSVVIFIIALYIASMGIRGIARSSGIILISSLILLIIMFIQMKDCMSNEQLNLFSQSLLGGICSALKNLALNSADILVFFGLLNYLNGSVKKAAGLYLTCDCIITHIFFLMCGSVMGKLFSKLKYSFFMISFATKGNILNRTDAFALSISTACAIITLSVILIILKDSVKYLFNVKNDVKVLSISSILLTVLLIFLSSFTVDTHIILLTTSIIAVTVLFILSIYMLTKTIKKGNAKE